MATYESLPAEQKRIIEAWDRANRGWLNSLATMLIQARALKAAADATGAPGEIMDTLDAGEIIPNTSGIAGAQDLTVEEMNILRTAGIDDFVLKYDVELTRQFIAKAAGPTAGL